MFTRYDKFLAAFVIALFSFIRSYFGIDVGVDDATANQIAQALMAAVVWLVPNKPKAE
jgi:hypothetical protein